MRSEELQWTSGRSHCSPGASGKSPSISGLFLHLRRAFVGENEVMERQGPWGGKLVGRLLRSFSKALPRAPPASGSSAEVDKEEEPSTRGWGVPSSLQEATQTRSCF